MRIDMAAPVKKSRLKLLWLLPLVVLPLVFLILLLLARGQLTRESLVGRLEEKYNCRAEIGAVEAGLLRNPGRIEIRNLALGERDAYVRNRTRLEERKPLELSLLRADRLVLDVSLAALLRGKIAIRELSAHGVQAETTRTKDGINTLKELFSSPEESGDSEQIRTAKAGRGEDDDGNEDASLSARDLIMPASIREVRVEDAVLYVNLEKYGTRVTCENVRLQLRDIEVDPDDLSHSNRAAIAVSGSVALDKLEAGSARYGKLNVQGTGEMTPFDAATGEFLPDIRCKLDIIDGSFVDVMPMLDAIESKIGDLENYGIKVEDLNLKGDIKKESLLHLRYHDDRYTLLGDTDFPFAQYTLTLAEGSWYDADDNEHAFEPKILLSPESTEKALLKVDEFVEDKVKIVSPKDAREVITKYFMEEGRLSVKFESDGDLGDPDVSLSSELPDLSEILKGTLEKLTEDPSKLIDGLLKLFE